MTGGVVVNFALVMIFVLFQFLILSFHYQALPAALYYIQSTQTPEKCALTIGKELNMQHQHFSFFFSESFPFAETINRKLIFFLVIFPFLQFNICFPIPEFS